MKTRPLPQSLVFAAVLFFGLLPPIVASAEWMPLPENKISSATLGGEILLIQMKYSLIIEGEENAKILSELGASVKKAFFLDIVMSKSAPVLTEKYGRPDRPATNAVINKYLNMTVVEKPMT